MKSAALFFLLFFLVNKDENIIRCYDCEMIEISDNIIFIPNLIEDQSCRFIFDLNTPKSTISKSFVSDVLQKMPSKKIGSRNAKEFKNIHLISKNKIFSSNNKIFEVSTLNKTGVFFEEGNSVGLYGYDFFKSSKGVVHLDFDDNVICNIEEKTLKKLLASENYKEIKSKFSLNTLSINIVIKRKEYEFIFDTGYSGNLIVPKKTNIFRNEAINVLDKKRILFNRVYYNGNFLISNDIKKPTIGVAFIKSFNWIIDYENEKVFVLKNMTIMHQ